MDKKAPKTASVTPLHPPCGATTPLRGAGINTSPVQENPDEGAHSTAGAAADGSFTVVVPTDAPELSASAARRLLRLIRNVAAEADLLAGPDIDSDDDTMNRAA